MVVALINIFFSCCGVVVDYLGSGISINSQHDDREEN